MTFLLDRNNDYGPARPINNNTNYPYNGVDSSPTSYDNKIHVSEIYGNRTFTRIQIYLYRKTND